MTIVTSSTEAFALSTPDPAKDTAEPPRDMIIASIDDDEAVRHSMALFLRAFSFRVETYASAATFLAERRPDARYCLISDVEMPDMPGPVLQARLGRLGERHPIIFVTAHQDAATREAALRAGALGFLAKPPDHDELLRLIDVAARQP